LDVVADVGRDLSVLISAMRWFSSSRRVERYQQLATGRIFERTAHLFAQFFDLISQGFELLLDDFVGRLLAGCLELNLLPSDVYHGRRKTLQEIVPVIIASTKGGQRPTTGVNSRRTYKLSSFAACSTKRSRIVNRSAFT
jgi:hypothetical protein